MHCMPCTLTTSPILPSFTQKEAHVIEVWLYGFHNLTCICRDFRRSTIASMSNSSLAPLGNVVASTSSWWLLHSTWPLWPQCDFDYLQQIWWPCQSATTLYILKKCRHFSKNVNKCIIKQIHFSKPTSNLDNWQQHFWYLTHLPTLGPHFQCSAFNKTQN